MSHNAASLPRYDLSALSIASASDYIRQLHNWLKQRFSAGECIYYLLKTHAECIDSLLIAFWQELKIDTDVCLIATGGYGRRELFPHSDIDLLILHKQAIPDQIADFIAQLWDIGLRPSHALRNIAECLSLAKENTETYTSLLDSRFIYGNRPLYNNLCTDLKAQVHFKIPQPTKPVSSPDDILQTLYEVEPNIKTSSGGLRDLQMIRWAACAYFNVNSWDALHAQDILTDAELKEITHCETFLYRVRFALHLVTNRKDNRLLFEAQIQLAQFMGFRGRGNRPVEKLMKIYYQATRRVSELNKLLLKIFHDYKYPNNGETSPLGNEFVNLQGQIHVKDTQLFRRDPSSILRLFITLATHEKLQGLSPQTLRHLRESRRQLPRSLKSYPQCRSNFIALLKHRRGVSPVLQLMHQHGVLAAYFREWRLIIGMMQFDMFHAYTVDEHTIRVLLYLNALYQEPDTQHNNLTYQVAQRIKKPHLLLLAGLCHDLGKGRKTPHTLASTNIARDFCREHGLKEHEQNLVTWLVENHLAMATTAHKRDIYDPEVIRDFAQLVRDKQHLDYLYCLTIADIRATNPHLWNNWRQTLLRQLYFATLNVIYSGIEQPYDSFSLLRWSQQHALTQLCTQGYDKDTICNLWKSCHADYFMRSSPEKIIWHTQQILDSQHPDTPIVRVSGPDTISKTEIFIYCKDKPHLFGQIISTLERKNLMIQEAHITTSTQGYAFDTITVVDHLGQALTQSRKQELQTRLEKNIQSPRIVKRSHRLLNPKQLPIKIATQILFLHNSHSSHKTSFELATYDRPGLLAQIFDVFTHLQCILLTARISTVGLRAENLFVIRTHAGTALSKKQRSALKNALLTSLDAP